MPIVIASFAVAPYAAILGLLYAMLSLRVANYRRRERVGLGNANHAALERDVRAHGNFIEYVPLALVLIWLDGATGGAPLWLHIMGIVLVVGRVLHIYSITRIEPARGTYQFRAVGMVLTLGVIITASILLLVHWLGYATIL